MSDTTMQNCKCCETEDDCINGLCELCSIYNQKLQKQSDLLTLGLLKEKNKYDTLKTSHTKLITALGHIDTCLSIIKCTKSEEGLKDLPDLATELKNYIKQTLKEAEKL